MHKRRIHPALPIIGVLLLLATRPLEAQAAANHSAHPRVLVSAQSWKEIAAQRHEDAALDAFLDKSEQDARALLTAEPVKREMIGRRLLMTSRRALRRVLLLSLHHRLTGDRVLLERAEREMLAVAGFSDWNPSHFLDVAEMTAALAIGYDWLYHDLSTPARSTIREAIVEKGLRPGTQQKHWWLTRDNNWNQVCLGGLTMGAIAVAEDEPKLVSEILQLARDHNHYGLKPYAPDGVYPEGPMYWAYGTSYQVVLLAALQSALKTDYDLSKAPGFMQSAASVAQLIAPSGNAYNFSDGVEPFSLEPALFWFARQLKQPALIQSQIEKLEKYSATPATRADSIEPRLLPLIALWWPSKAERAGNLSTLPLQWLGRGENPVGVFRSAWNDANATYLAFKGGGGASSHAHLDAGSFIFEADGVRWAKDLGMENYNALETRGLKIWDKHQDAERWKVFRHSNLSHNTLTINGQLHNVTGHAEITHFSGEAKNSAAIVELDGIFKYQAAKVRRGFAYRSQAGVLIRDELEGLKPNDSVRWQLVTSARIELNGGEATLRQSGKVLCARLLTPGAIWEVVPVESLMRAYDSPNHNTRMLVANFAAPATGKVEIAVELLRENAVPENALAQTVLDQWRVNPVQ